MPQDVSKLRIFVASPGDVKGECECVWLDQMARCDKMGFDGLLGIEDRTAWRE